MNMQSTDDWLFFILNGTMFLKINNEWADDTLMALNESIEGKKEIELQWAEYDKRGAPFVSYQKAKSRQSA